MSSDHDAPTRANLSVSGHNFRLEDVIVSEGKLWYLTGDRKVIPADAKKVPDGVEMWCREGDQEWQSIDRLPGRTRDRAKGKPIEHAQKHLEEV